MKKKIVFIASYPQSLVNFRLNLMRDFLAKGYEVIAIAPADETVKAVLASFQIDYIDIPLQRNGLNPFLDLALVYKIWRQLRDIKPQFVFAYTIKPIIYGSVAAKLAGVPQIYSMITGTGYVFLDGDLKSKIVGLIARQLFRVALFFNHLVFFQNKDNLFYFKQQKMIAANKPTAVINGSGVDCQTFLPTAYPVKLNFLMIARFLYDKGIREYVAVARQIKQYYPDVTCSLVGWIDTNPNSISAEELEAWVAEGVIQYLGKLSDVREAITNASVYVLPSYHEGTPRTVLEAMAMARPIITTDAPGCKETVVPKQNGFLVPVKETQALYAAMEYFILHPEQIEIMGKKSRELALEKYDVNLVNASILNAIPVAQ